MLTTTCYNFTFDEYEFLVKKFQAVYKFINFTQALNQKSINQPVIIWRHDVDISVHKAVKLAYIEATLGIKATYFFMLGSRFYDIRNPEIYERISQIKKLGHHIALHYDFEYLAFKKVDSLEKFTKSLQRQKDEIEYILQTTINVFSFHNPSTIDTLLLEKINKNIAILNMVNVYSHHFKNHFKYCSDSNGLWRYEKPEDLINPEKYQRLHILTHPEWWDEQILSPRKKVLATVLKQSESIMKEYDDLLQKDNRINV